MHRLLSVSLVLPLSTACVESGFSGLDYIKNDRRNRLKDGTLDSLLRIFVSGPSFDDAQFGNFMKTFMKKHRKPVLAKRLKQAKAAKRPGPTPPPRP